MARDAPHQGPPGRPPVLPNPAFQFGLAIRVLFKLPLGQTSGMGTSLLRLAVLDWPVPDSSTLCRGQKTLGGQIPHRRAGGTLNLLADSRGSSSPAMAGGSAASMAFRGAARHCPRTNGGQSSRRKVHLAMDTATSDIRVVEFTLSRTGDSPLLPVLLDQIPQDEGIGIVNADGACGTRRRHSGIIARGGRAFGHSLAPVAFVPSLPIRKNGRPWKGRGPAARVRNEILRARRPHGCAFWKRLTGYHARSRAESRMRRLKAFGERTAAVDHVTRANGVPMAHPDRQTAETQICVTLMNRFNALGTTEIVHLA